jgi:F-type H+-transporting ATPase subunit b
LIAQIINFVILLYILQRFLYKPLFGMMEKRRTEIKNALANAEKVKQDAALKQAELEKQLEATRREGQEAIARALAQSEKARQEIIAKANTEAAQIKAKALSDVEYERKQALAQLQGEIANLSLAVTRKVLGAGVLDENRHRQLVQQFLSELESA